MRNAFNTVSNTATSSNPTTSQIRLRKSKGGGAATKLPHQVLRRNERERKRVQQVRFLLKLIFILTHPLNCFCFLLSIKFAVLRNKEFLQITDKEGNFK